jgi:O-antigen ligase
MVSKPANYALNKALPAPGTLPVSTGSEEMNPVRTIGMGLLVVFVFVSFSRSTDMFLGPLHIPMVSGSLALGAMLVSGGVQRAVTQALFILLALYTAWMAVTIPFSTWSRISLMTFTDTWSRTFVVAIIIMGLVASTTGVRVLVKTLGWATIVIVISTFLFHGVTQDGRWYMRFSGTLGNPNDLAQYIITGIPFLGYMMTGKKSLISTRVLSGLAILGGLYVVAATGSRGGFIAIGMMVVFLFFSASMVNRFKLLAAVALAGVMVTVVAPGKSIDRLRSLLDDKRATEQAEGSTQARMSLLKYSLKATLNNPVFGVGMGMSEDGVYREAQNDKRWIAAQATHNTYLQVSSELGIPGLLIFMTILVVTWRAIGKAYRFAKQGNAPEDVFRVAYALRLSFFAFLVSVMFYSIAYTIHIALLTSLNVVCAKLMFAEAEQLKLQAQIQQQEAAAAQAAKPVELAGASRRTAPLTARKRHIQLRRDPLT